jgi:hypothetical protein
MKRTCSDCDDDMIYLGPGDPPRWIEAWACDCGRLELTPLARLQEIEVTIGFTPPPPTKETP